jgi:hypothetical protein
MKGAQRNIGGTAFQVTVRLCIRFYEDNFNPMEKVPLEKLGHTANTLTVFFKTKCSLPCSRDPEPEESI